MYVICGLEFANPRTAHSLGVIFLIKWLWSVLHTEYTSYDKVIPQEVGCIYSHKHRQELYMPVYSEYETGWDDTSK